MTNGKHTQLCVARHGETDWNAQGILQGWLDVPINEVGRRQALDMAAGLTTKGVKALWTSPLLRALETAEIIAEQLDLPPPLPHAGLKERCFGEIQGIPKSELGESNPLLLQQILRRNPVAHFAGGETMDEFADRVLGALADIGTQNGSACVLIITHGWVMDVIKRQVENLPRQTILNSKPKNGDLLWLQVDSCSVARLQPE